MLQKDSFCKALVCYLLKVVNRLLGDIYIIN